MKINKTALIIAGICAVLVLVIVALFVTTNNKAITLEEQILEADSAIKVQEKRRVDLIYNLVDTVEQYAKHEAGVLSAVTEARQQISGGNIDQAGVALNAVAEAYPALKADVNYRQLMTEFTVTENLIAQYRENYNYQVKAYNKHIRQFPSRQILANMGYEPVDFTYKDYEAPSDAPQNLFGGD